MPIFSIKGLLLLTFLLLLFTFVSPVHAQTPSIDLKANGSNGPLTLKTGDPLNLTWTTTNNPLSCTGQLLRENRTIDSDFYWSKRLPASGGSQSYEKGYFTEIRNYIFRIYCSDSELEVATSDEVRVNFTRQGNCTTNSTCGFCTAPANTCGTNNGTQKCLLVGDGLCTPVESYVPCTIKNCSSGYSCQGGQCISSVQLYAREPELQARGTLPSTLRIVSGSEAPSDGSGEYYAYPLYTNGLPNICGREGTLDFYGRVTDTVGYPVSNQTVTINYGATRNSTTTNSNGNYCFDSGYDTEYPPSENPHPDASPTRIFGTLQEPLSNCYSGAYSSFAECAGATVNISSANQSTNIMVGFHAILAGKYLHDDRQEYLYRLYVTPDPLGPYNLTVNLPPTTFTLNQAQTQAQCSGNSSRVNVSWSASQRADYYLVFKTTGSGWNLASPVLPGSQTSFTDISVQNNIGHAYAVYAYNSSGATYAVNNLRTDLPYVLVQTLDCEPRVSCAVAPTSTEVNQNVTWTAASTGGTGTPTYIWSGENLNGRTGTQVSTSYSSAGSKTATVSVTTSGGGSASNTCSNNVNITLGQPPTIQSLNITQGPPGISSGFGGSTAVSGRLSDQQGSNWKNSIDVQVTADDGSSKIKEYKVEFTGGFTLKYQRSNPIDTWNAYVIEGGNEQSIHPIRGLNIGDCSNLISPDTQCKLVIRSSGADDAAARWRVFFYPNFGDRPMNTAVTVTDFNSQSDTNPNCPSDGSTCP